MAKKFAWGFSKVTSAAFVILLEVLLYQLINTGMFPARFLIIAGCLMGILGVLLCVLTWNANSVPRYMCALILQLILCETMLIGIRYVHATISTLQTMTNNTTTVTETADGEVTGVTTIETSNVAIYVLADDENAGHFADVAADYSYGIASGVDREATDTAIASFESDYSADFDIVEYDSLTELADALLNGEVRAIILNESYLEVISDMEGYEGFENQVIGVKNASIQTETFVAADTEQENNVFTMYISGSDSRTTLSAKARSDVNILAVINTDTHQVLLINTPRDYYVPLSISNGVPDKLTHAGIYGINCSMDTIGMIYDIDVDYYFRLNFTGFTEIIDALGGVSVWSDYTFNSKNVPGYSFKEGYNQMNGEQAIAFVKERYAFSEGDRQRGRDQMYVIQAVIDKATSPEILLNYLNVLNAAEGNFETSMSYDMIADLVRTQLDEGGGWNVSTYSVNGTGDSQIPYSMSTRAYVMIPDESTVDTAKDLIQQVIDGEVPDVPG